MSAPYFYWQKVPLGWRDAPAVVALASHIRKRDPRLLLLDLWDWAKVHGDDHPISTAADTIERGAGWRGKRGIFYQGLVAAGWVRENDGRAVILDWDADGIVKGRPTLAGVLPDDEVLDPEDKQRIGARKRKRKSRANKNPVTVETVTERDASVTCHSESVTERDSGVTENFSTPPNRAESPVYAGIVTPKSKREEEEKEKEPEKNLALFENRKGAEASGKALANPLPNPSDKPRRGRPPKDRSPEAEAERLAEKADGDRWMDAARRLTGLTADELRWSTGAWMAFRKQRKARGIDQLLRALEGLESDTFSKTAGLGWLVSDNGITKGLATAARRANVVGIGFDETWDRYAKEAGLVGQ